MTDTDDLDFDLAFALGDKTTRALMARDEAGRRLAAARIRAHLERCRWTFTRRPPPKPHST